MLRLASHLTHIWHSYASRCRGHETSVYFAGGRRQDPTVWARLLPAPASNYYVRSLLGEAVFHAPHDQVRSTPCSCKPVLSYNMVFDKRASLYYRYRQQDMGGEQLKLARLALLQFGVVLLLDDPGLEAHTLRWVRGVGTAGEEGVYQGAWGCGYA